MSETVEALDQRVRLAVYQHLLATGVAPTAAGLAGLLETTEAAVSASLERLAEAHVLVLEPETRAIRMAMPFSAVPTGFRVEAARGGWWANCAWDALGISAMLAEPVTISTTCADCDAPLKVEASGYDLTAGEGVVHFAVPARHWWDDIGFT